MAKPGDVITVKVGGVAYETVIDEHGVQRFKRNEAVRWIVDNGSVDLNGLGIAYRQGRFDKRSYAELNMMLGYSVNGFRDLSSFEDWEIENPLWEQTGA